MSEPGDPSHTQVTQNYDDMRIILYVEPTQAPTNYRISKALLQ